jgi:hypothetical protein
MRPAWRSRAGKARSKALRECLGSAGVLNSLLQPLVRSRQPLATRRYKLSCMSRLLSRSRCA